MAEPLVCPACGALMRFDRIRCLRCGTTLPARPAPAGDRRALSWVAGHRQVLIAGGGVVALVAALLALAVPRRHAAPATAAPSAPVSAAAQGPRDVATPVRASAPQPLADPHVMGTVAYHEGDYQAAYDRYRDAVARNPNDAESLSNCGQALVRLGRPAEAVPLFERAIELNGRRWAYHFNLARASGLLSPWDRAIQEYRTALELFPDDPVTEFNLAMALHKTGDEAAAVEHYRRAIDLAPDEADFYLALGMSSERLGRAADALVAYRRYVEMAPASPDAPKVRARIGALAAGAPGT